MLVGAELMGGLLLRYGVEEGEHGAYSPVGVVINEYPSLVKMLVVYLLIAPSLRNRRPAIAVLERPSAIKARTDRSRSVSFAMGSARARRRAVWRSRLGPGPCRRLLLG